MSSNSIGGGRNSLTFDGRYLSWLFAKLNLMNLHQKFYFAVRLSMATIDICAPIIRFVVREHFCISGSAMSVMAAIG